MAVALQPHSTAAMLARAQAKMGLGMYKVRGFGVRLLFCSILVCTMCVCLPSCSFAACLFQVSNLLDGSLGWTFWMDGWVVANWQYPQIPTVCGLT